MGNSEPVTILRSAVGSTASISLINELRKKGVKIIGIDSNPLSAGLYLCDKGYVVPKGNDPKFLDEILRICDIEKPNLILPGPEEEIIPLSKNKKLFNNKGVLVLCPDYETVKKCSDKLEISTELKKINVPVPEIYQQNNSKYSCIIKPRFGRGSQDVFKIQNAEELDFYLKKVSNPIIQEYIKGDEYSVDVLCDPMGNIISIVPRKRLQVESGISIKGITIFDKEIINYCAIIAKELKLIGPSCIQCMKNNQGLKFFDINPRFGGGSILSIKSDPTIIPNLIKIAKGEAPTVNTEFKENLTMLRYYNELFCEENDIIHFKDIK